MTDNIGQMIGLGIGLAFGLQTMRTLSRLSPIQKNEIQNVLSQSFRDGGERVIVVKLRNKNRVQNILKRSGFKIISVTEEATAYESLTNPKVIIRFDEREKR